MAVLRERDTTVENSTHDRRRCDVCVPSACLVASTIGDAATSFLDAIAQPPTRTRNTHASATPASPDVSVRLTAPALRGKQGILQD